MATESIDGILDHVLFHKTNKYNPGGIPFLIARLHNGTTVKGEMRHPAKGESYRFWGNFRDQKNYSQAFEFSAYEPIIERSDSGIAQAIAAHVKGIGKIKAYSLVGAFGVDTLDILRGDPARALEVKGITQAHVDAIRQWFDDTNAGDPVAYARLVDLLSEHRVPKRVIDSLLKNFGSEAANMVRENPYILMDYPRIGWQIADSIALSKCDYPRDGIERHKAAVLEAMERIANDGHTVAGDIEIYRLADSLLGMETAWRAFNSLLGDGEIIISDSEHEACHQLSRLADAEETIARKIAELSASASPLPGHLATIEWVKASGLGHEQTTAAILSELHGVCIITGAPGTGKSYAVSRILGRLKEIGVESIRVVAPTGKAAKRAAELLAQVPGLESIESSTVHRALAPTPNTAPPGVPSKEAKCLRGREEFGFARNEGNPIDAQVLVIDEASMLDVKIAAALLKAVAPGTRLIIVGDPNQLPSVGPGSFLRDLLAAGVPSVELGQIRRSDGGGRVVRACHSIKDGRLPEAGTTIGLPTENWIHIEREDPQEIAETIRQLHVTTKTFDPIWGMQCISAQKSRLAFACDNLNTILADDLNPERTRERWCQPDEPPPFFSGDKVIRISNGVADELKPFRPNSTGGKATHDLRWAGFDWEYSPCPVVNGDMGQVVDVIDGERGGIIVRLRDPYRLVRLPLGEHNLQLAYAITVHKAQGSGFPYVIVPVHQSFYWDNRNAKGLFSRELLYTAISRAEKLLVTVGQWGAIEQAVGRKTVHRRRTSLAGRLAGAMAATEVEASSVETGMESEALAS